MFKFVIVGSTAFIAFASDVAHPVNEDMVKAIKAKTTKWTPAEVHENPLSKIPAKKLLGLLGTNVAPASPLFASPEALKDLPDSFDSRTQWPNCIHPIRN